MRNEFSNTPMFSVIIPVYNVEKYLSKCLDSIIAQNYTNIEIILVDDGSIDSSGAICDEYSNRDSRIRVIHKKNGGLVSARKAGLEKAVGKFISCIDSDDWVEQGYYSDANRIIEEYNVDVICYACFLDSEKDCSSRKSVYYLEAGYYDESALGRAILKGIERERFYNVVIGGSLCRKIIRKVLYAEYQKKVPDRIENNEDDCVSLPIITHAKGISVSNKAYYHYLQRQGSIVHTIGRSYEEFIDVGRYIVSLLEDEKDWAREWFIHRVYSMMWQYISDFPASYVREGIPFLPKIKQTSKVVVYGKGDLAKGLLDLNEKYMLFNLVRNIDSSDIDSIDLLVSDYDYIFIAIFDYQIVDKCVHNLNELNVKKDKILTIDKRDLLLRNLPKEIWECT